jgi:hypothetical protein
MSEFTHADAAFCKCAGCGGWHRDYGCLLPNHDECELLERNRKERDEKGNAEAVRASS